MSYQATDRKIINYQIYPLGREQHPYRGPKIDMRRSNHISFVGAAQTFGRFAERPFPTITAENLNLSCLNLGIAGGGPEFFIRQKDIIDTINTSKMTVVQVMSGRSVSSPWIHIDPALNANLRPNPSLFSDLPPIYNDGTFRPAFETFSYIFKALDSNQMKQMIEEHRQCWVIRMVQLAKLLAPPTILFWFSRRPPEYQIDYSDIESIFGEKQGGFPQLVNQRMIDSIKPFFSLYVESITNRGYPSIIKNVKTGSPVPIYSKRPYETAILNYFYPSPEMHEDAAAVLTNALLCLLDAKKHER